MGIRDGGPSDGQGDDRRRKCVRGGGGVSGATGWTGCRSPPRRASAASTAATAPAARPRPRPPPPCRPSRQPGRRARRPRGGWRRRRGRARRPAATPGLQGGGEGGGSAGTQGIDAAGPVQRRTGPVSAGPGTQTGEEEVRGHTHTRVRVRQVKRRAIWACTPCIRYIHGHTAVWAYILIWACTPGRRPLQASGVARAPQGASGRLRVRCDS
jgi:hypothetical protein